MNLKLHDIYELATLPSGRQKPTSAGTKFRETILTFITFDAF